MTPAKLDALRARITTLGIVLDQVEEQFIRASGPGGQKVNKTSSGVRLAYAIVGTPIAVKWTRERHRALNRFLALRELVDEVEARVSPQTSARVAEAARRRKQKGRARRRRNASAAARDVGLGPVGPAAPRASDPPPPRPESGAAPVM